MNEIATTNGTVIEKVLLQGDLSGLTSSERLSYYNQLCNSIGLNPLSQPFEYATFQGKLKLYARKDCTEQLRKLHGVSIMDLDEQFCDGIFRVKAKAKDKHDRTDCSIGAVSVQGLKGEALANALMKAETKAKRRVTLSICGLGFLDETEVETVPSATVARMQEPPAPALPPPASPSPPMPDCITSTQRDELRALLARADKHEQDLLLHLGHKGPIEQLPVALWIRGMAATRQVIARQQTQMPAPQPQPAREPGDEADAG